MKRCFLTILVIFLFACQRDHEHKSSHSQSQSPVVGPSENKDPYIYLSEENTCHKLSYNGTHFSWLTKKIIDRHGGHAEIVFDFFNNKDECDSPRAFKLIFDFEYDEKSLQALSASDQNKPLLEPSFTIQEISNDVKNALIGCKKTTSSDPHHGESASEIDDPNHMHPSKNCASELLKNGIKSSQDGGSIKFYLNISFDDESPILTYEDLKTQRFSFQKN